MFGAIVKGSEQRKPVFNLLFCLVFMALWCPSTVVAILRPKRIVRRLLSGLPATDKVDPDEMMLSGAGATMNDKEQQATNSSGIGGGAINEKIRHYVPPSNADETTAIADENTLQKYSPSKVRSHLYHALEGLDRYPNYLARWNAKDIGLLEESLQEKIALVRQQREALQERTMCVDKLVQVLLSEHKEKDRWERFMKPCQTWDEVRERILDPQAAKAIFSSKMFQSKYNKTIPSVENVLNGQTQVEVDPGRLEALLDEELYDVYSFRLLSDGFCEDLREFVKELSVLSETVDGMEQHQIGKRPFDLDMVGLGWVNDLLFHLVMRPISRQLFFESEDLQGDLDWRNGYIAGYSAQPGAGKPRERLVTHTDDSEVTLNVCLGDVFEGGLLEFRGLRGTPEEGQLVGEFQPQIGLALIHAGRHFHDVAQVTSGDRFAYIMWARSWAGIRSQKCPCCWLNRREGTDCVCGSRWN